ncbi:MAG: hypothetical protein ACK5V3_17860 [Bdellovibrionales bacterium]
MNPSREIFLSLFFLSTLAWSSFPLDFSAEKNNIQILPQKFEYSLRDSTKLLLGNRIIDSEQFRFEFKYNNAKANIKIIWPEGLIQEGRVLLTNPSGLEIWSREFVKGQKEIELKEVSSLLNKISSFSFFRFCVGYFQLDTGLDICSPELMLKGTAEDLQVVSRNQEQRPEVQINGRTVTQHGIVFLNDDKETLQFRAVSKSGAEFKIDTKKTVLEFPDVIDINEKSFLLTVEGPTPLAPSNFKKVSENRWTVPLLKERAQIYISGAGQVPLRQEFIVVGPLPKSSNRIYLKTQPNQKSYSSQMTLIGDNPREGTVQSVDRGSDVKKLGSSFQWIVRNVPTGMGKTSYLGVFDGEQTFSASYKTSRQDSGRIEIGGLLATEASRMAFNGEAQLWFENPFKSQVWSFQRMGIGLHHIQEVSGDDLLSSTNLSFYFRIKSGLQYWDPSFYFTFGPENWTYESSSFQSFNLGVGWVGPAWNRISYFDWNEIDLKYSLPGNTSSLDLKQALLVRWKLYKTIEETQKFKFGLGLQSLEILTATAERKASFLNIEGAWVKTF